MSCGSPDLLARSPQNVPYFNVADESASVSIRSGRDYRSVMQTTAGPSSRQCWGRGPIHCGSFSLDHRPRLQALDEFASKSLTSHQRANRRRQLQLNSMSMSQDKGARPIAAIQTKVIGDRSEGERAGGLRVEEEEWGSGVKRRARQEHPLFILGPMRNGVCIKSLTGHRSSRRRHCGGESAARFSLPLTQVI
jgi:hypothetical protein